ncbi:MAG: hypothetical protein WC759_02320 [Candidatus Micrarchaeia archaeon]|jgi:hypothetical protein
MMMQKTTGQMRKEFVGVLVRELHKPAARKDARTAFFNYALGKPGLNKDLPIVKYYFSKGAMKRHLEFSKARIDLHNKCVTEDAFRSTFVSAARLAAGHMKLALKLARPKFMAAGFTEDAFVEFSKYVLNMVKALRTLETPGDIMSAALKSTSGHVELAVELARPAFRRIGMTDKEIDHLPLEIAILNDPTLLMMRTAFRSMEKPETAKEEQDYARGALERLGYSLEVLPSPANAESQGGIIIGPSMHMYKTR